MINKMIRRASPKGIGSKERFEGLSGIERYLGIFFQIKGMAGARSLRWVLTRRQPSRMSKG